MFWSHKMYRSKKKVSFSTSSSACCFQEKPHISQAQNSSLLPLLEPSLLTAVLCKCSTSSLTVSCSFTFTCYHLFLSRVVVQPVGGGDEKSLCDSLSFQNGND